MRLDLVVRLMVVVVVGVSTLKVIGPLALTLPPASLCWTSQASSEDWKQELGRAPVFAGRHKDTQSLLDACDVQQRLDVFVASSEDWGTPKLLFPVFAGHHRRPAKTGWRQGQCQRTISLCSTPVAMQVKDQRSVADATGHNQLTAGAVGAVMCRHIETNTDKPISQSVAQQMLCTAPYDELPYDERLSPSGAVENGKPGGRLLEPVLVLKVYTEPSYVKVCYFTRNIYQRAAGGALNLIGVYEGKTALLKSSQVRLFCEQAPAPWHVEARKIRCAERRDEVGIAPPLPVD